MDASSAIKQLQQIKQDKQKKEEFNTTKTFANSFLGLRNSLVDVMAGLTKIIIGSQFATTVRNFPKSFSINNKKLDVEVLNFPKDKEIQKVEVLNQEKVTFDTTKLEQKLTELKLEGSRVPPILESSKKAVESSSVKMLGTIEEVLSAIKRIKLNPEIKVSSPKIEIPAPIVNVKETKIPPFPKTITADVDFTSLSDKLDDVITELQYNAKQGVHVTNPGDFPVSTTNTRDLAKEAKQDDMIEAIENIELDTSTLATESTLEAIKDKVTEDVAQTLTYNADGTIATMVKVVGGVTYTKTFSYTSGNITGISAWVAS